MGKSNALRERKRKQAKHPDFPQSKKSKQKVGRRVRKHAAAMNPSVRSQQVHVPQQTHSSASDGAASTVNLSVSHLSSCLKHTCHYASRARRDGLLRLSRALRHYGQSAADAIAPSLSLKASERLSDSDASVRSAASSCIADGLLPNTSTALLQPHMRVLCLNMCSALAHVSHAVRSDALSACERAVNAAPVLVVQHGYPDLLKRSTELLHSCSRSPASLLPVLRMCDALSTALCKCELPHLSYASAYYSGLNTRSFAHHNSRAVPCQPKCRALWSVADMESCDEGAFHENSSLSANTASQSHHVREDVVLEALELNKTLAHVWASVAPRNASTAHLEATYTSIGSACLGDDLAMCIAHLLSAFEATAALIDAVAAEVSATAMTPTAINTDTVIQQLMLHCRLIFEALSRESLPFPAPGPSGSEKEVNALIEANICCAEIASLSLRNNLITDPVLAAVQYISIALDGIALPSGALTAQVSFPSDSEALPRYEIILAILNPSSYAFDVVFCVLSIVVRKMGIRRLMHVAAEAAVSCQRSSMMRDQGSNQSSLPQQLYSAITHCVRDASSRSRYHVRSAFFCVVDTMVQKAPDDQLSQWLSFFPRALWEETSLQAQRSALRALHSSAARLEVTGSMELQVALSQTAKQLVPFFYIPGGGKKRKAQVGPVCDLPEPEQLSAIRLLAHLPQVPDVLVQAVCRWITSTSDMRLPPSASTAAIAVESLMLRHGNNACNMEQLESLLKSCLHLPAAVEWDRRKSLAYAVADGLALTSDPSECLFALLDEELLCLPTTHQECEELQQPESERRQMYGALVLCTYAAHHAMHAFTAAYSAKMVPIIARYITCAYAQGALKVGMMQELHRDTDNTSAGDPLLQPVMQIVQALRKHQHDADTASTQAAMVSSLHAEASKQLQTLHSSNTQNVHAVLAGVGLV